MRRKHIAAALHAHMQKQLPPATLEYRLRKTLKMPLKSASHALAAMTLALALSGCAGMRAPYGYEEIKPESIDLIPVTAEVIAKQKSESDEIAPTAWSLTPKDYVYKLQAGDLLSISVPTIVSFNTANGPTLLSSQEQGYLVYNDGTIFLPYSGSVVVKDLTLKQAQETIVKALSGYLRSPQVVVAVQEFRSQRVMVTGQVVRPGYLPVTDVPLTLVGALSTAGGVTAQRGGADPRTIGTSNIATSQNPVEFPDLSHVLLKRGGQTYTVNVEKLMASGDVSLDPLLVDGDVVVVPPVSRNNIFVLGEVERPGLLEIGRATNLAQAVTAAGGIAKLSANASRLYVIRGDYRKPTVYQVDAGRPDSMLLAQKFDMQPNDVIFIAETKSARYNRGLAQILPTVQGLLSTAIVVNTVDNLGE